MKFTATVGTIILLLIYCAMIYTLVNPSSTAATTLLPELFNAGADVVKAATGQAGSSSGTSGNTIIPTTPGSTSPTPINNNTGVQGPPGTSVT